MAELVPNTVDAAVEKHVPAVEKTADGFKITVGSVTHPMDPDHYIQWITFVADDGITYRKFLSPAEASNRTGLSNLPYLPFFFSFFFRCFASRIPAACTSAYLSAEDAAFFAFRTIRSSSSAENTVLCRQELSPSRTFPVFQIRSVPVSTREMSQASLNTMQEKQSSRLTEKNAAVASACRLFWRTGFGKESTLPSPVFVHIRSRSLPDTSPVMCLHSKM